jgi:transcription initiation factor TFIID subunit 7
MKSWDKKGWIKSIDISQMLLVLGRCNTDEEARNYPLPPDVDPKNYQYAHGLTAPMKWVRKRRFARTKRTRVDDIESVERRVKALLEADKAASQVRYQVLDHDPRLDEERYSSGLDDEDAEGEDDDDVDGYFSLQNGHYAPAVETPVFTETPVEDIGQDEVDEFERMFVEDDEGPSTETADQAPNTLHIPNAGDSSFAVTSTSASPSATAAHTPASAAEQSSDEDDDDEGGEEDEDLDDAEKQGDENLQQVKDRIEDMQQKIAEQTELLKKTQNAILKKKLARKIQDLKDDVSMMKKNAGLGGDEDDD